MRRAHKLLSLLLVLTLALSLGAPVGAAYSDTSGHWAEDAIDRWSAYGIVSGVGNGFDPDGNLTRGQMAKILAEALGLTKQGGNPFADVAADAWYTPYVLRCYEAGIMRGDGVNANPDAPISREEAMVMLCRALGIAPASEGALSSFSDGGSVSSWAAPYVAAMVQSGIVNGVGNNTLVPAGNISRASLMTILDRSVVQYISEPGSYELTDKAGIILVAAGDVTLTGTTSADVLVSPAAEGKAVVFDKATVTGSVTVQAEDAKVTSENSTLPDVSFTGEGGGEVETVKPTEPTKPSTGGGSSGGGSSSHTHTWNEGAVTTAATCTTAGVKTYTCTGCSQTRTEAIPATGHSPAEAYTTDETGHWHVCTVCGEPADKAAHTYPEGTACASAANCTVEGCGYVKAAGDHVWGEGVVTTEETCTETGAKTYTCTVCSATKPETIPALGHNYAADFTVDTEATCTTAGSKSKHCSRCDAKTEVTAIPATGHSYGAWNKKDDNDHEHTCSVCNTTETEAHEWNENTCTKCSASKPETKASITLVEKDGTMKIVIEGTDNKRCGVYFVNSDGKNTMDACPEPDEYEIEVGKLPVADGTYSLILCPTTEPENQNSWGLNGNEVLARLDNAVVIESTGEAVQYSIDFTYTTYERFNLTWTEGTPAGLRYQYLWCDKSGISRENTPGEIRSTGNSVSNYPATTTEEGWTLDVRIISAWQLDGQVLKVFRTPESKTPYAVSEPTEEDV